MRVGDLDAGWVVRKKDGLSIRGWMVCGGWVTILGIVLLLLIISAGTATQMLLALLVVYVCQGCLAELIGVKIKGSGFSFPNRAFPRFPYLVFFRCKLPRSSVDRVDFIKGRLFIIYPAMRQVIVPVMKSHDEKRVARFLRDTFPSASVKVMH